MFLWALLACALALIAIALLQRLHNYVYCADIYTIFIFTIYDYSDLQESWMTAHTSLKNMLHSLLSDTPLLPSSFGCFHVLPCLFWRIERGRGETTWLIPFCFVHSFVGFTVGWGKGMQRETYSETRLGGFDVLMLMFIENFWECGM